MANNRMRENIIGFSRLMLVINLVLCIAFLSNLSDLSESFKEIGSGFFCASVFMFVGFIIRNKPECIIEFFMSKEGDFRTLSGVCDFVLYLLVQVFILIFVLAFVFLAYYIIDYEFINDGLKYFSINYSFNKPEFLVKLSFIITSSVLAYFYSNCKDD